MNFFNASNGNKETNASNGSNAAATNAPATGGARRRSATKKPVRKTDKPTSRKVTKTSTKTRKSKQDEDEQKQYKNSKKGGSFVGDVQNLAVPFAILLAKEGLSKVFKKDGKTSRTAKSASLSAKSASRPASLRRKSTLSGGSCNLGCGAMTGGRAARELFQLQKEIDNFLEKY